MRSNWVFAGAGFALNFYAFFATAYNCYCAVNVCVSLVATVSTYGRLNNAPRRTFRNRTSEVDSNNDASVFVVLTLTCWSPTKHTFICILRRC